MAITFDNSPLKWDEAGVEPSETLKKSGYKPKDNPAAENENYFRHSTYKSIKELQDKSAGMNVEGKIYETSSLELPEGGTTPTEITAGAGAEIFNHYSSLEDESGNIMPPNQASGKYSHAQGFSTIASGDYSHAQGQATKAIANNSHSEGSITTASGDGSHAEGGGTTASGDSSHAEGQLTTASGDYSHAQGANTKALGKSSHAGGSLSTASGECSFTHGASTTANDYNFVIGKFNKTTTASSLTENTGDLFVIGSGLEGGAKSNALRVTAAGDVMGVKAYAATGADYSELFMWQDGNPNNEDRRGLFVTLDGEKIRLAKSDDDYIVGVVSATPSIIGDACSDDWHGKYVTDVFGARVLENGAYKLSDGFDETLDDKYISRLDRPEWSAVGLVGKLIVVDDGTCQVNGYCYPSENGIATDSATGFRVMSRIDENHIKILLK
jgi:hypothetical protein